MPTIDMFNRTKPRRKARVMAKIYDAGEGYLFKCNKCGWDSGWIFDKMTYSEVLKGIPCEQCNEDIE